MVSSMFSNVGSSVANPGNWQSGLPGYMPLNQASYLPIAQTSAIVAPQAQSLGDARKNGYGSSGSSGMNYTALAQAADVERQQQAQRAAERQAATLGGYDQQMIKSQSLGNQGYQTLAGNYDAVAADAAATRERNMARVDQYGNSMRQDLDIKAKQAMAAAGQSAIKRGLGNTTIYDSLQRGQQFDNTRQQLSLEDQLLQNKISTDSSLSNAYQGVLQNRAQSLASQWNQNISNDNQLAGQKLGYLGSIQENMDGFNSVANLYSQQLQMDNSNQQAALSRAANAPQVSQWQPWTGNPASLTSYR